MHRQSLPKIALIALLIGVITLVHYMTGSEKGVSHVIFRELYFLPIILGGFWFGIRGGISSALLISVLYGPLVFMGPDKLSPHDFGNTLEIFLFNLVGGLLGWLKDRDVENQIRLLEAETLAAMGRATAMIAHDLKTPLVTISGLSRRLAVTMSPETSEGEKVKIIQQQAGRLEKLVRDMLFYARPMELESGKVDLYEVLLVTKDALWESARENNVTIVLPTAVNGWSIQADREKITLVFINLMTNAIEASPPGESVSVIIAVNPGELSIDIVDKGSGIPEDLQDKIFEPFITGKEKGTGLGLPISRKIVEAHRGKLECLKNSEGTTFRVIIPAYTK